MSPQQEQIGTLSTILITCIATLAGVIAYLWRQQVANHDTTTKRLDECTEHHMQVAVELATIKGETRGVRQYADEVLEKVEGKVRQ